MEVARLVMMRKMTVDFKSIGKNTGYTQDLHGQKLSGKGCCSYFGLN